MSRAVRDAEIRRLLREGLTGEAVAQRFGISPATVSRAKHEVSDEPLPNVLPGGKATYRSCPTCGQIAHVRPVRP